MEISSDILLTIVVILSIVVVFLILGFTCVLYKIKKDMTMALTGQNPQTSKVKITHLSQDGLLRERMESLPRTPFDISSGAIERGSPASFNQGPIETVPPTPLNAKLMKSVMGQEADLEVSNNFVPKSTAKSVASRNYLMNVSPITNEDDQTTAEEDLRKSETDAKVMTFKKNNQIRSQSKQNLNDELMKPDQKSFSSKPVKIPALRDADETITDEAKLINNAVRTAIPNHLREPRLSVNMTIKNLARNKDSWRGLTLMDNRKVFALPAFLQISALDDIMLTELVAQGGLGVIWKGELQSPELISLNSKDKLCAVKIIVFNWKNESEFYEVLTCFRQEVTIIYALAPHPNIVRLLGYAESQTNDLVLVEELCDINLKSIVHDKGADKKFSHRLSIDDILVIAAGIADGVMWMHQHGVIHNDLKPHNILINFKKTIRSEPLAETVFSRIFSRINNALYTPKICDMGLATIDVPDTSKTNMAIGGGNTGNTTITFSNTITNKDISGILSNVAPVRGWRKSRVKGFSTRYASPEAYANISTSEEQKERNKTIYGEASINIPSRDFRTHSKTDMWGVGVIIWEMLHRKHPYEFMNDDQVRGLVLMGKAELPFKPTDDSSEIFLQKMIKNCWHYYPEKRISSDEMLQMLDRHVNDVYS